MCCDLDAFDAGFRLINNKIQLNLCAFCAINRLRLMQAHIHQSLEAKLATTLRYLVMKTCTCCINLWGGGF